VPTYQYSCTECSHFFEIVQRFSDDALTVCPECEGRLRKVFNAVGVVFKGSGFYRTDSRGQKTTTEAGSSGAAEASSGSGGSAGAGGTGSSSSSSTTTSSTSATAPTPA
jgi:putative FmdB family regulatory protein